MKNKKLKKMMPNICIHVIGQRVYWLEGIVIFADGKSMSASRTLGTVDESFTFHRLEMEISVLNIARNQNYFK